MNARANGDQYRAAQLLKNTVVVDMQGYATAIDDHLREIAEGNVYYVPEADAFVPRPIRGATVRSVVHAAVPPARRYRSVRQY